jgi:Na+/H+ antiporter NhaD/arsenite permease-like protein
LAGAYNIIFLLGVIGAVFLPSPYREGVMILMAALSIVFTPKELRKENAFTYHPITEVAVLFIGIFLAMIPALQLLEARGAEFGLTQPWQFFWATGTLSSFLDNAPTYLSFLSLLQGMGLAQEVPLAHGAGVPATMLMAVSAGAVLMGANSYIGNGPNFMVKAIADEAKIKMPSFFGYVLIAALVLWPIFLAITFIFFRP